MGHLRGQFSALVVTWFAGPPLLPGCCMTSVARLPELPISPNTADASDCPARVATADATFIVSAKMLSQFILTGVVGGTGTLLLTWLVTWATSK